MSITRLFQTLSILLATLVLFAGSAFADTIQLKDGTKLEGRIIREGDGFVYIAVKIGDIEHNQFVLTEDIEKIIRSEPEADEQAPSRPADRRTSPRDIPDGATRVAFITLEGMVGPYMNANSLRRSVEMLEGKDVSVVVLDFDSGGGYLSEIQKLSDVIEREIKPKYRTVSWIRSAISAAAMTSITCEEIYFTSRGSFGGATGFFTNEQGKATAISGDALDEVLRQMEIISRRGQHDPLLMRAMQIGVDLSCDIDSSTGAVTWRNDLDGQYIVSTKDRILTLNSRDAERFRLSRGTADNKDALMRLMNIPEWVEVGHEADEHQQRMRAELERTEVQAREIIAKLQIALNHNNVSRARAYLGELRGLARRAPAWTEYPVGDLPPLTPEFFRDAEEAIDQFQRSRRPRR
ncbi:MAG: hypothetical protein EA376_12325 [Phycisphaeraceae bacterium]|nr:MAG: hypothetical protein EA376_12325 [Phycisphaeraceae bacterium]